MFSPQKAAANADVASSTRRGGRRSPPSSRKPQGLLFDVHGVIAYAKKRHIYAPVRSARYVPHE